MNYLNCFIKVSTTISGYVHSKRYLFLNLLFALLASCAQINEKEPDITATVDEFHQTESLVSIEDLPDEKVIKTIQLKAVGDIQMGRAWPDSQQRLPENADVFFDQLSGYLSSADLTFGNLETVIADEGESKKCKRSNKCFAFRVPTSFVTAIEKAGFDLLSNNNNHANDFGEEGMLATLDAFLETDIQLASRLNPFVITTLNGVDIGLVAFATGGYDLLVQDIEKSAKFVEALARSVDILVVSFHAGAEGRDAYSVPRSNEKYYGEDRGDVYAFSHAVIDAGADLVLGHGPHVLRGLEVYNDRLIAYSLGNFTAWRTFKLDGKLGESMILDVTILEDGRLCEINTMPVMIDWPGVPRPADNNNIIRNLIEYNQNDFENGLINEEGKYHSAIDQCRQGSLSHKRQLPNIVDDQGQNKDD